MNAIPQPGDKYGRLTVLRKVVTAKRGPKYACGCACGSRDLFYAKASGLNSGRVTSCKRCVTDAKGNDDE